MSVRDAVLDRLLDTTAAAAVREAAWDEFIETHTRLLMHVARTVDGAHDGGLDAYAHLLEKLREDEYRRLRAWRHDGRSRLTTWLVVVARRLCVDMRRQRYGRARDGSTPESMEGRGFRRRLVQLEGSGLDLDSIPHGAMDPDQRLRVGERDGALREALATLPAADRLVLQLRFEEDLSGREIAARLHLPSPFHAFRRIAGVLQLLRLRLRERGIVDPAP